MYPKKLTFKEPPFGIVSKKNIIARVIGKFNKEQSLEVIVEDTTKKFHNLCD